MFNYFMLNGKVIERKKGIVYKSYDYSINNNELWLYGSQLPSVKQQHKTNNSESDCLAYYHVSSNTLQQKSREKDR